MITTLISKPYDGACRLLEKLQPLSDLVIRLYVANVFWKSGLTKIESWDSTLFLFENIYAVPVLPTELAAVLGTAVELVFPVLLVLGLAGRFAAAVLFLFNIVAVISFPDLGAAGIAQHTVWGLLLLGLVVHGVGRFSLDELLRSKWSFWSKY